MILILKRIFFESSNEVVMQKLFQTISFILNKHVFNASMNGFYFILFLLSGNGLNNISW